MEETKKPDWWLVKIDERQHWREDIQAKTTAIYGVYAFDRNERTFCCELTPSYCLWFIACDEVPSGEPTEEQREALNELILTGSAQSEPVSYYHVRLIERLMEERPELFKQVGAIDLDDCHTVGDELNKQVDYIAENWGTGALMF